MPRAHSAVGRVLAGALVAVAASSCSVLEPALGPSQDDDAGVTMSTGDAGPTGDDDGGDGGSEGGTGLVSFAQQIRPLMNRSDVDPTGHGCALCHYPGQGTEEGYKMTGLDLSTLGALRKGGSTTGTGILDTSDPTSSGIVEKLQGHYFEGARMPKSGPPYWSDDEIQLVITWISQGAQGADSE